MRRITDGTLADPKPSEVIPSSGFGTYATRSGENHRRDLEKPEIYVGRCTLSGLETLLSAGGGYISRTGELVCSVRASLRRMLNTVRWPSSISHAIAWLLV